MLYLKPKYFIDIFTTMDYGLNFYYCKLVDNVDIIVFKLDK